MVVSGTYYPYLVVLSILVASFASYTALDLGGHVGAARGLARQAWLVAAAITMGGGIWSMHFIGMLAFVMPIPMSYDIGLTILSLVVAIVVTGGGFFVISRQGASPLRLVLSGIFMGLGIVAMHYTGMAAMRGHAELGYDRLLVALSVVIAIGASTAALWLAFQTTNLWQKLIAALVMGLAISGMHYTGMRAAIFTAHDAVHDDPVNASLDQINLALAVAGITFVILAVASIASLSEQKRAEEALRQAQADLARVNRVTTMGALTASIAHEVNQPITAAATNADACMRWLSGDPPNLEEARAAAMGIVKDAMRAAEIINRIRLLFKKGTTQRELLDVNDVIREMIVLLRGEVAQHSVSVRTELAADLPQVMGDRVQLQQVMMNLMSNSIDAMKDVEGPRELAIKSQRAEKEHLMVSVSDTGVGLPTQQADQIFNAFVSTKLHGTGMGLSISRSIIESHSGRLWAADNSPRGASFHLTLPAKVEARE
ncbi:MAG TPA: MHYT domain-containing protein [Reyranella sp.]|jgi:NO-binding membrane sensor protein with MHYT domain|nr:MHYT domain-containing protein [Reyranella sp.]